MIVQRLSVVSKVVRIAIAVLLLTLVSAFAEDFKTTKGAEIKGATVTRVEPDGLMLMTSTGIVKVYFSELPKEIQEKYHYDPAKAADFARQDADRQLDIYERAQAAQRAVTEQKQAEIRAEAQGKQKTTSKVIAQKNTGLLIKPGEMTVLEIAENPFSCRGYIVEVRGVKGIRKQEVAPGVYRVHFDGGSKEIIAELTANQCDSIAQNGRLFVRVKEQEEYDNFVPVEVVGTGVTYEGLSRVPTFYWKQ
jgi:hypothetical protein